MADIERILSARMSRRRLLACLGLGAGAVWLASACEPEATRTRAAGRAFEGEPSGTVSFANWPLYMDKATDEETGERYIPSLRRFTQSTGIEVDYREVINGYPEFLAKLIPSLQAGDPVGWDIIVIGGRELTVLQQNGWLVRLDEAPRPNFDANAASWAADPSFDPGAGTTMAWQAGYTGLAVNRELVPGQVTKLDDLADPSKVGRDSVGMIESEMPDFVMWNLGIDPVTSTPDDWKAAADWLMRQRESGTVRAYYGQDYISDLTGGNLTVSMGWSGDVFYYRVWGGYDHLEFLLPEGGGVRWIDSMAIPVGAEHPVDAITLMDFYYDPEVAVMVTEWVFTTPPVEGVQELVRTHGEDAVARGKEDLGRKLLETADNPFTFPSEEVLAETSFQRDLRTEEEREEWDDIFVPISQ